MKLTAENVNKIFADCLFQEDEDTSKHVEVQGILNRFGFHPDRLKSHTDDIIEMLHHLPDNFQEKTGGGWSFLEACVDKTGHQWGEQKDVNELMCLGLGVDAVVLPLPRKVWNALPGGMPYFVVLK